MSQDDIQREIIEALYKDWANGRNMTGLRSLIGGSQWEEREASKAIEQLKYWDLMRVVASDLHSRITPRGILKAEREGIAPAELRERSERLRTNVMDELGKAWVEKGPHSCVDIDVLRNAVDSEEEPFYPCLKFLQDVGYIEDVSISSYRITPPGYECVREWRQKVSLMDEFTSLYELTPQARGKKFQKLLARILGGHGWRQEEGVRTSHEEMDVIVHREREYYLIECKWEKDPTEAAVIRELHGKLSNRVDVRGIAISLSGFTAGAVTQAQDYAGSRIILLFGRQDVEKLIARTADFEELLSIKYNELVSRRKAIFE